MRNGLFKFSLKLFSVHVFVEVLKSGEFGAHWTADDKNWFGLNNQVDKFVALLLFVEVPWLSVLVLTFYIN